MVGLPGGGGNWLPPIGNGGTAGPLTLGAGFGLTTGKGGGTGTGFEAGSSPPDTGGGRGKSVVGGIAGTGDGPVTGKLGGMTGMAPFGVGGGGGSRSAAVVESWTAFIGTGIETARAGALIFDSISLAGCAASPIGTTPATLGNGNWLAVLKAEPWAVGGGVIGRAPPVLADWNPVDWPRPADWFFCPVAEVCWIEPGGEKAFPVPSSAEAISEEALRAAFAASLGLTCHIGGGEAGPLSLDRKPLPLRQPVSNSPVPKAKPHKPAFSHFFRFERITHPLLATCPNPQQIRVENSSWRGL